MRASSIGPAVRGTALAFGAALSFGLSTPLLQRLARGSGPFAIACLLYAGAALVCIGIRSPREAPVATRHLPRIALVAVAGALLAPALLAWGLSRASGTAASLMLNLEAAFTIALARLLYREHVGARVAVAAAVVLAGGALLVFERSEAPPPGTSVVGLAAVAGAALAWSIDNAVARPLSLLDPASVVAAKASLGALLSAGLALGIGSAWPTLPAMLGTIVVGATGYGLSLRLYLKAQRALGAGRTASVFASAPFWGAGLAWLLGEPAGLLTALSAGLMIAGLVLHVTERHSHEHAHEAIEHEHWHRHDDGHHDHAHDPMPAGHSHVHRHEAMVHDHPHVPDLHHGHDHLHDRDHDRDRDRDREDVRADDP